MSSRSIGDLSARMQILCQRHLDRCRRDTELLRRGIEVVVICTYRDNAEQARLYAQGRDPGVPGKIVTNAKPGQSAHNKTNPQGKPAAEAYDVMVLRHGKPVWGMSGDGIDNNPADDNTDDLEIWQMVGAHGQAVGLQWYGAPNSPFREGCHFQNPEV